jgi:hypothetical protein
VRTPTLLIVGGRDDVVLELNRKAEAMLRCELRLAIVPGATHLFEESGTLQVAAELARDWFITHFEARPTPARLGPCSRHEESHLSGELNRPGARATVTAAHRA